MKHKHLLSLLQTDYVTVQVSFNSHTHKGMHLPQQINFGDSVDLVDKYGKLYTYKCADLTIKAGELAIVHVAGGFKLVTVMVVDKEPQIDLDADFTYQWIVQKVDTTTYDKLNESEAKFNKALVEVEKVSQRDLLMKKVTEGLPEDSPVHQLFKDAMESIATVTKVIEDKKD